MKGTDKPDVVLWVLLDERTEKIYQAEVEKDGKGK
jgi:hypothetical protein